MIPFRPAFVPGVSLCEQIVYAATKAIVGGRLRAGEVFPSVRALSTELRVNPNTAHKAVAQLVNDGLLEVLPGIGTVVAERPAAPAAEKRKLIAEPLERVVVEAMKLGMDLSSVQAALETHWEKVAGGTTVKGKR